MNTIRHIRHLTGILAASAGALLALAVASPAMAATASIPPSGPSVAPAQVPVQVHTVIADGMTAWQVTLIAAGAALLAAFLAVAADRARATRRRVTAQGH